MYGNVVGVTMIIVVIKCDADFSWVFHTIQSLFIVTALAQFTWYEKVELLKLTVCLVCGSYQCPYCPYYNNSLTISPNIGSLTLAVILTFIMHRKSLASEHWLWFFFSITHKENNHLCYVINLLDCLFLILFLHQEVCHAFANTYLLTSTFLYFSTVHTLYLNLFFSNFPNLFLWINHSM